MAHAPSLGQPKLQRLKLPGIALIAGSLALACAALRDPAEGRDDPAGRALMAGTAAATPAAATQFAAAVPEVSSWLGIESAGGIRLDGTGGIIPDSALRELFDHVHSAVGQLDMAGMQAVLQAIGRQHRLLETQLAHLDAMFAKYLDYLRAVSGIRLEGADIASMRKAMEERYWLRRNLLGLAMADGFFAASEAEDRNALARMEVIADKTLSVDQRASRLAALVAEEPAGQRAALQLTRDLSDLAGRTGQLRQAGAGVAEIQALRVQMVGSEAAERFNALDKEQAAWDRRMRTLVDVRQNLWGDPNVPAADRQRRLEDIIARDFRGPEILRARAILDSMELPG